MGPVPIVTLRIAAYAGMIVVIGAVALWASATQAAADFRLCNQTGSRVGVSVGYKDRDGWTTEGWWNVGPKACETLLRGTLVARYYYIYAVDYDRGGEWSGQAMMCTRDKEFTVRGTQDCLARGYDRTGFFEVDTSEQQSWTVQLTEATERPAQTSGRPPAATSSSPPLTPRSPVGGPAR
jgi:uncharacterized membrane protein